MHVSERLGRLRIHRFLSAGDAHGKNGGHHGGKADSHQIHFYLPIEFIYVRVCKRG